MRPPLLRSLEQFQRDDSKPSAIPRPSQVSIHIRTPQTGRRYIIPLLNYSEYLFSMLDERLPYFSPNGNYDIHTLLYDTIELYLYKRNISGRDVDTQLEFVLDEVFLHEDYGHDEKFDFRCRLSVMRSEVNQILRTWIPRVEDWWHFNFTLDTSMTLWLVVE